MGHFLSFVILLVPCFVHGQLATEYGSPVKWVKSNWNDSIVEVGIDTQTLDTILLTRTTYVRKSVENEILEKLDYDPDVHHLSCIRDDGIHPTGYYKRFYVDGSIREIGAYFCGYKIGKWYYFYPNGKLEKYENYEDVTTILGNHYIGRAGIYKEYYPNGSIKISGNYRLYESYNEYEIVNLETYAVEKKCCKWHSVSEKEGIWIEYDLNGNILNEKVYRIMIDGNPHKRDFVDQYLELDINKYWNEN